MRAAAVTGTRTGAAGAMVLAGVLAASAQSAMPKNPPLPPVQSQAVTPTEQALPPYEAQLDRLAEIIGTLAFMRGLCGDDDGSVWHDKMASLLDAEGSTNIRRDRLAGSYNQGFQGYRLIYRTCTPSAHEVIARSLDEGSRLARDLSVRFGAE